MRYAIGRHEVTFAHEEFEGVRKYVQEHDISIVFGFDQHVKRESYRYLREGGLRHFFSCWGASMSSIHTDPFLLARSLLNH